MTMFIMAILCISKVHAAKPTQADGKEYRKENTRPEVTYITLAGLGDTCTIKTNTKMEDGSSTNELDLIKIENDMSSDKYRDYIVSKIDNDAKTCTIIGKQVGTTTIVIGKRYGKARTEQENWRYEKYTITIEPKAEITMDIKGSEILKAEKVNVASIMGNTYDIHQAIEFSGAEVGNTDVCTAEQTSNKEIKIKAKNTGETYLTITAIYDIYTDFATAKELESKGIQVYKVIIIDADEKIEGLEKEKKKKEEAANKAYEKRKPWKKCYC